ncbi:hypothetical protein BDE40_1023 [Litoreibacter halocynthiae]|uniref:Uncharacterized protein n=2 Tax=Litoreibacter TaxID=947567 RepID=A0A4R7LRT3_9RHOB|nr:MULTISPECIES: hypothetical protein [Litoreibacter]TDT77726.1 hypothetical protein BDE40_1023 [Litoreibacter halocynthiae]SHE74632.1 hypothetical protein SAMN05444273_102445 [Litoreibacter ascidiaceicola]
MQHIQSSYQGLSLLISLNWDRLLWPVAIVAALATAGLLAGL